MLAKTLQQPDVKRILSGTKKTFVRKLVLSLVFNPIVGRYHLSSKLKHVRQVVLENSPFIVANDTTIDLADRAAIRNALDDTPPNPTPPVDDMNGTKPVNTETSTPKVHTGPVHFKVNLDDDSYEKYEDDVPTLESINKSSASIELHPESNSFSSPEKAPKKIRAKAPAYNNWTSESSSEEDYSKRNRSRHKLYSSCRQQKTNRRNNRPPSPDNRRKNSYKSQERKRRSRNRRQK